RYSDQNVDWIPLRRESEGWRFRHEKDGEHEVFIPHRDVYARLSSGAATIRYKDNAPESQVHGGDERSRGLAHRARD
ncbi:hypothetical protein ACC840_36745, partial [Rhizobium ruizarguesonis]